MEFFKTESAGKVTILLKYGFLVLLKISSTSPAGFYQQNDHGPARRPFDLVIPSWAYAPAQYTGHMQYLPHQPLIAAPDLGEQVAYWILYQNEFRQLTPAQPAVDPIYDDLLAFLKSYRYKTTTPAPKVSLTQLNASDTIIDLEGQDGKTPIFKTCTSSQSNFRFGVCVDEGLVTQLCIGKFAAKSVACAAKQLCCLDETLPVGVLTSTGTTGSQPSANFSTLAVALSTSNRFLTGFGTKAFISCRAVSGVMTVGICVNEEAIDKLCRERFLSRSANCGESQFCCFDGDLDPQTNVTGPTAKEAEFDGGTALFVINSVDERRRMTHSYVGMPKVEDSPSRSLVLPAKSGQPKRIRASRKLLPRTGTGSGGRGGIAASVGRRKL